MVYKNDIEENIWLTGNKVTFPDGTVISVDNKEVTKAGWFWSDTEPIEYTNWVESQNEN